MVVEAAWYQTVDTAYGVPLDTRHTYSTFLLTCVQDAR